MATSPSNLLSSVEHRLSAWAEVQYRLSNPARRAPRPTITVSRRFGCEGYPLAERLKRLAEEASGEPWTVYDRALIETVASEEGISIAILRNLGETSRALEALGASVPTHVSHDKAFEKIARYIVQIALVGNAVVVGRGGAILCAGMANCYHFRLEAGLEWRVETIMRRHEVSRREAEHLAETGSKQRERFMSYSLGVDVADAGHYDAIFNNERHTVDDMASSILAYVRSAFPDRSYFKH
jgi:cytidylate kinase